MSLLSPAFMDAVAAGAEGAAMALLAFVAGFLLGRRDRQRRAVRRPPPQENRPSAEDAARWTP